MDCISVLGLVSKLEMSRVSFQIVLFVWKSGARCQQVLKVCLGLFLTLSCDNLFRKQAAFSAFCMKAIKARIIKVTLPGLV